jgi:hypothetical protein
MAIDPEELKQVLDSIKCTDKAEKKITVFQYINTVILTVIGIFAMMIYISNKDIKRNQNETGLELIRMKTIQDINTNNIGMIDKRLNTLETNYLDYIKTWVDDNFIRKTIK